MSVGSNLVQIHRMLGQLSERMIALESRHASVDADSVRSMESVLGEQLEPKLDAKLEAKLDAKLNAALEPKLDAKMDAKLDAKLDSRLDVRVSVALKRERAFLEAAISEQVTKAVLDSVDIRHTAMRMDADTKNVERDARTDAAIRSLEARTDAAARVLEGKVDALGSLVRSNASSPSSPLIPASAAGADVLGSIDVKMSEIRREMDMKNLEREATTEAILAERASESMRKSEEYAAQVLELKTAFAALQKLVMDQYNPPDQTPGVTIDLKGNPDLSHLLAEMPAMRAEQAGLHTEQRGIRQEITSLKAEVASCRGDSQTAARDSMAAKAAANTAVTKTDGAKVELLSKLDATKAELLLKFEEMSSLAAKVESVATDVDDLKARTPATSAPETPVPAAPVPAPPVPTETDALQVTEQPATSDASVVTDAPAPADTPASTDAPATQATPKAPLHRVTQVTNSRLKVNNAPKPPSDDDVVLKRASKPRGRKPAGKA